MAIHVPFSISSENQNNDIHGPQFSSFNFDVNEA